MRKGVILIIILLFPALAAIVFSLGEHHAKRLGFYGAYQVNEAGDTLYAGIRLPFSYDQHGASYDDALPAGEVVLLNFFEMPCEGPCLSKMNTVLNYVHKMPETPGWCILNVAMNETSESELTSLAEKNPFDQEHWRFRATELDEDMRSVVAHLAVDVQLTADELISDHLVLLDQEHRIRAVFNTKTYKDTKMLEDAIKLLLQEPHIAWKKK